MSTEWGPGNRIREDGFRSTVVGGADVKPQEVDLFFGEHPHQRRDNTIYGRGADGHIWDFDGIYEPIMAFVTHRNYFHKEDIRHSAFFSIVLLKEPNKVVFEVGGWRDPVRAFLEGWRQWEQLQERCYWYPKDVESQKGKHCVYSDRLCRIVRVIVPNAEVILAPVSHRPFEPAVYLDDPEDDDDSLQIKESLLTPRIWWHPRAWHYTREGLEIPLELRKDGQ